MSWFNYKRGFENPQSGLLKTREIAKGLPFFDTSYCRWGYGYRKTTSIWSNLALCLRKPCSLRDPCSAMVGKRHPMTAQQGRRGSDAGDVNNSCSQRELYRIPDGLCDAIAEAADRALLETDVATAPPNAGTHAPAPAAFV